MAKRMLSEAAWRLCSYPQRERKELPQGAQLPPEAGIAGVQMQPVSDQRLPWLKLNCQEGLGRRVFWSLEFTWKPVGS